MREDLTDKRFGILKAVRYAGNSSWECVCECGKTTIVKTCNLKNGHTKSCGCLAAKQASINGRSKMIDLTDKRFGKLKVISYEGKSKWKCLCDCGRICYVAKNNLMRKSKPTRSCGCLKNLDTANDTNIIDGTNVGVIKSDKVYNSNKTTGVKGVCYIKSQGIYKAYIYFRKKRYYLKSSKDINVCIKARKEAEENIFGNFLEWLEEYKKQSSED